jgi:hypothetical protein
MSRRDAVFNAGGSCVCHCDDWSRIDDTAAEGEPPDLAAPSRLRKAEASVPPTSARAVVPVLAFMSG